MSLDIDALVDQWQKDEIQYGKLGRKLLPILKDLIFELEIFPEVTFRVKDLLSLIRKIKKKQSTKSYTYKDVNDKLGFRIICNFSTDMDLVEKLITDNFTICKADRKKDALDHNVLDYISNHYDVSIDASKPLFKKLQPYKDLVFEIQVKTLNQHAWSNTSHAISYKQEANISDLLKRRVFRLLSLYEIADDEFTAVNTALCNTTDDTLYKLLRKTEGKIYKYAKTDFDRDVTVYTLNKLIQYFTPSRTTNVINSIETFINQNDEKLRRIFSENANRYYKLPFLTQPEIFVIWYALEHFPFSITDNWANDFDVDDLEQIQTLWGRTI